MLIPTRRVGESPLIDISEDVNPRHECGRIASQSSDFVPLLFDKK
jgi:hypothetical protein